MGYKEHRIRSQRLVDGVCHVCCAFSEIKQACHAFEDGCPVDDETLENMMRHKDDKKEKVKARNAHGKDMSQSTLQE